MKRTLVLLILSATLLAACGGGGGGNAQGTAAVETAVAALLTQQAPAPDGGEAPTEAAPADNGAAPTSVAPQTNGDIPPLPSEASCVPLGTERVYATVTDVWSGDSIQVTINGASFEVRYIGIDAPEGDEPGAAEALAANRALVEGKTVGLVRDVTDVDQYGRLVRYVVVDDAFVNLRLLQQRVAFVSIEEPDMACERLFNSQ